MYTVNFRVSSPKIFIQCCMHLWIQIVGVDTALGQVCALVMISMMENEGQQITLDINYLIACIYVDLILSFSTFFFAAFEF